MSNTEKDNSLKILRSLRADLKSLDAGMEKIVKLEGKIKDLESRKSGEEEEVLKVYQNMVTEKIKSRNPVKEVSAKYKKVPPKKVKRIKVAHMVLVVALAVAWLIASFVIMKAQILPEESAKVMNVPLFFRAVYIAALIYALAINVKDQETTDAGRMVAGITAIPAIIVILTARNYDNVFADMSMQRVLDYALGVSSFVIALFAPMPNRAYYRALEKLKEEQEEQLKHVTSDAQIAYRDRLYEANGDIRQIRDRYQKLEDQIIDTWNQIGAEQKTLAATREKMRTCCILEMKDITPASLDFMISTVERGRADTLEEAQENWHLELKRREKEWDSYQCYLNLIAEQANYNDTLERQRLQRLEEAKRKNEERREKKDALDRIEESL